MQSSHALFSTNTARNKHHLPPLYCLAVQQKRPYTVTKPRERWNEDEHQRFLEALKLYGRQWRKIEGILQQYRVSSLLVTCDRTSDHSFCVQSMLEQKRRYRSALTPRSSSASSPRARPLRVRCCSRGHLGVDQPCSTNLSQQHRPQCLLMTAARLAKTSPANPLKRTPASQVCMHLSQQHSISWAVPGGSVCQC